MNKRDFTKLLDKVTNTKTKLLDKDLLGNLTKEECHSIVAHLSRNRTAIVDFFVLDEDRQWLASCGYLYEKTNKAGFKMLCTSENMNDIKSVQDEQNDIISYAVKSYGFLLWKEKQFSGKSLAETIKSNYDLNPKVQCILNHLQQVGEKIFDNPQYFAHL